MTVKMLTSVVGSDHKSGKDFSVGGGGVCFGLSAKDEDRYIKAGFAVKATAEDIAKHNEAMAVLAKQEKKDAEAANAQEKSIEDARKKRLSRNKEAKKADENQSTVDEKTQVQRDKTRRERLKA